MHFPNNPILPQTPKMQELSELIKRSHESEQDYQNLKHLIDSSALTLGEKMSLHQILNQKFSR